MNVDELIKRLQELREEYGNEEVCIQNSEIQDVVYVPEDDLYEDGIVIY